MAEGLPASLKREKASREWYLEQRWGRFTDEDLDALTEIVSVAHDEPGLLGKLYEEVHGERKRRGLDG